MNLLLGFAGSLFFLVATAQAPALAQVPQFGADTHLGVTSCAGSTCHGAVEPFKQSNVLQNEYLTWQRRDKHSKAYSVLLNDRSKRIAANLGLPAANTAQVCLDCHADNVPAAQRGRQFQISDGVGCESCHGGSVRWLGIHISGSATQADLRNLGLYPTAEPVERAKLCLSCHFGDDRKFVTHKLMGAGHPRMSFELDTFTEIQPAHFNIDDDYRKRKRVTSGVQMWAIGQAMALSETMGGLLDPKRNQAGIFPELVFFDCYACHHPMSDLRWQARASTGLGPGVVRFNDANALMLKLLALRVAPEEGRSLATQVTALHAAMSTGQGQVADIARQIKTTATALIGRFASHSFGAADMKGLIDDLVAQGLAGDSVDYAAAEQQTMALASISSTLRKAGIVDEKAYAAMQAALDRCYQATAKDETYKVQAFTEALAAFKAAVPAI